MGTQSDGSVSEYSTSVREDPLSSQDGTPAELSVCTELARSGLSFDDFVDCETFEESPPGLARGTEFREA